MKPLWFSLSGIEQKYNWRIFIFCPFLLLFHLFIHFQTFSYFFQFLPFQVEEPISSSKPSQLPGSNGHVNSNETVKYWYSAQLCCCFISLENYNFLQEKILPTQYSYIFKFFLIFTPVSSTSSGRNLFLPGSHHSFWFTSLGRNSNKVFIFSTFLAVVSLVWELQLNIYLIMHFKLFSSFFQFLPLRVEETYFFRDGLNRGLIRFLPPGGRNLPTLHTIYKETTTW